MKKITPLFLLLFASTAVAQPTISALNHLSGYPGSAVTITGSGFNATAASNIVYFGATRATVTGGSSTSLNVTVPAGATYMPVTVNNGSGLTGYSGYAFLPTYNNSAYWPGTIFDSQVTFTTGNVPNYSVMCDIDGDGKPDMIVVNNADNTVAVFLNNSLIGAITAGSFAAPVTYATGNNPNIITVGDIDGDGRPDIVVPNLGDNTVSVLRNISSIGVVAFEPQVILTTINDPLGVAIGDIDGDGKPDLAVTNWYDNTVSVLLNTSFGSVISFSAPVLFATGAVPNAVVIGDIDGDGIPDIATTNNGDNTVSVLLNTSSGGIISFADQVTFATGNGPGFICMGDIDNDGRPDIVYLNARDNTAGILHNISTISLFDAQVTFATGNSPSIMALGDVNGDGMPDLAAANSADNTVSVLLNTSVSGSPTFGTQLVLPTGQGAAGVTIDDVDGDGKPDILVVNNWDNTFSVLRNNPYLIPPPHPSITSVSPAMGKVGDAVTITGTDFSTVPANNIVYFGATRATVTGGSSTSLNVTVPVGASFMPVTVNNDSGYTAYAAIPFVPTYDNSKYLSGITNFDGYVGFAAGYSPTAIIVADIDGDGKPDIVVGNFDTTISVFRNISAAGSITAASFAAPVSFRAGNNGYTIAAGDIDGDGKQDIAIVGFYADSVTILRNTSVPGSVSFAPYQAINAAGAVIGIAIGDLDGDGKPEIAIANGAVLVLHNTSSIGSISFAPGIPFAVSGGPGGVAIGDIDGDGIPDLATCNSNSISVLRNVTVTGNISPASFEAPVSFTNSYSDGGIALGDVDGDGKVDIVTVNDDDATVSVFHNTSGSGSISFDPRLSLVTGYFARGLALGDINGDGKPDIAVAHYSDHTNELYRTLSVYLNNSTSGSVSFADRKLYPTGGDDPGRVVLTDLDGDGLADLLTAGTDGSGSGIVSILRNDPLIPPPTITAVSPDIAIPGAGVTIIGSNFNTMATNNIVYFGATRATVTSGSSTSLNVTVPTGASYMPVSVNNDSGSTAYAQYAFLPTYNNSAYLPGAINMAPAVTFSSTHGPGTVLVSDIDGDGKPDMVVMNGDSTISVFRNISVTGSITTGSFAAPVTIRASEGLSYISCADMDGDGKPDIIATMVEPGGDGFSLLNVISVFRNISSPGAISFAAEYDFSVWEGVGTCHATGDIDGDGKPDVVFVDGDLKLHVLRNASTTGNIGFESIVLNELSTLLTAIVVKDVDGDGKPDILITGSAYTPTGYAVFIIRNTSSISAISVETPVLLATGQNPYKFVSGDIDGDGKPDIAVVDESDGSVLVFRNTSSIGAISFAPNVTLTIGMWPDDLGMGDMDGDGKPDLVVTNGNAATVSVFRSTSSPGTISYGAPHVYATGATIQDVDAVVVNDMDGDNKADIIIVNPGDSTVSILRNDPLLPPPTITSVSPGKGAPGAAITITGTNFNTTAANDIVYFGATRATVNTATATSLNVTVPAGATYMPVTVNNTTLQMTAFSSTAFLQDYNNSAYRADTVNFDPRVNFVTGNQPYGVVIGDLDGDGKPDVIVGNIGSSTISVFLNTSSSGAVTTGSFSDPMTFDVGGAPYSIAIGDIDGDGKPDLAVSLSSDYGYGSVSVLRNTSSVGAVSFADYLSLTAGAVTGAVCINDIDGDGRPDIVVANIVDNTISVFSNESIRGVISFAPQIIIASGNGVWTMTLVDIDRDGKPDMEVANYGDNTISVFHNNSTQGNVSFEPRVTFGTGNGPTGLNVADMDQDGKPDIVFTNSTDNNVGVLRNISSVGVINASSFSAQVISPGGNNVQLSAIGDINGDGLPDIALINFDTTVSVLRNTSTGAGISFAPEVRFGAGNSPNFIAIGDLDGDGKPDMVVTNINDNIISILRNDPLPNSGIAGATAICQGAATTLTDPAPGGTWSSSNTATATVSSTGVVSGVAAGTATISYNTGTTATIVVTINPLANKGSITGIAYVCVGLTTNLTNAATGGVWSSTLPAFGTVSSTGVVAGIAAGTTIISYTATNGCGTVSATAVVTVNALPDAGSITGTAAVCVGVGTNLTDAVAGGMWSSTMAVFGTVSAGGVVRGISPGTTTISYTAANGCGTVSATAAVTINPLPNAGSITGVAFVCAGLMTSLTDAATGGVWSSAVPAFGTVNTAGVVRGISSGTTTISYTATNGCGTVTATAVVTVNAPSAGTITGASAVTIGSDIGLLDGVAGGVWSSSNNHASVTGGYVTGVSAGVDTISYTVTNSCGPATATKLITVNGSSVSGINGNATVCLGTTTIYTDATTGGNWSSSNISVATVGDTTGVVTGIYTGTATIYYTAGGVSTSAIVTVIASPADITGAATVCVSANVTISDGVAAGSWTSSNSNVTLTPTGSTLSIYGATAGTTTLTYSLADACYRTYVVMVNPLPAAISAGAGQLCVGGTLMVSDATGGAIGYGSSTPTIASVINSGKVTGVAAGTTTITYEISTGCMTTTIITVNTAPGAIGGNVPVCAGTGITLTDNVNGGVWSSSNTAAGTIDPSGGVFAGIAGGSTIISYSAGGCAVGTTVTVKPILLITGLSAVSVGATITLSDATASGTWSSSSPAGSVSTTGVVTGISTGTTTIIYTYSGCTRSQLVTVNPALGAVGGNPILCQNTTTTLTPPTGASGGTWSSSNTVEVAIGSASGIATAGPYTGTVTITYTQAPGSYSTFTITLNPLPATIVGPAAPKTCPGASFTVSDATTGGLWSSSNPLIGSVSTTGGVGTVTGESAGIITLTYTLPTACSRVYGPVTVNPQPAPINTGAGMLCQGGTLTVSDVTGGATGYTSSNTGFATVAGTGVVTGVGAGVATITYYINTGCYITAPITVNPTPVVAAISGPSTISRAAPATLSDATPGGVWSSSNIHVYTLSGTGTQTVTATALVSSGGANIYYSLSNGFGCTTTMTKNLVATARYAQGGNTTVYTGGTVAIADEVMAGEWASGDNTIATVDANGIVTGIRAGSVEITHNMIDEAGEQTTATIVVTVKALPASISIVPNPNKGTFTVKGTLGSVSDEEVSMEVTDVLGQVIYKSKVQSHGGAINETLTLGNSFANGMYILNVVSGTEKMVFHFVMER